MNNVNKTLGPDLRHSGDEIGKYKKHTFRRKKKQDIGGEEIPFFYKNIFRPHFKIKVFIENPEQLSYTIHIFTRGCSKTIARFEMPCILDNRSSSNNF